MFAGTTFRGKMAQIKLSEKKARLVCAEILEKIKKYEGRMMNRLDRWNRAAELYSGRTYTQR